MTEYSSFNSINGTNAADTLNGGREFDLVRGGAGDDIINGGGGLNAVVYDGVVDDYDIDFTDAGRIEITSAVDGKDTLANVQFAIFEDKVVSLYEPTQFLGGFNEEFYLQSNPDVYAAVQRGEFASGEQHFERFGITEGRVYQATNGFDAAFYVAAYPEVNDAGLSAVEHYELYGRAEGRATHPFFDENYYLAANPDVAAAGVDAWDHFSTYGWQEGRNGSPFFDGDAYLEANPDVAAAGINPLLHYVNNGMEEGRDFYIDQSYYDLV